MNKEILFAIARKDLKEVRQNRAAWIPAIVIPLVFVILIPLVIILIPNITDPATSPWMTEFALSDLMQENIPALADKLTGFNERQTWIVLTTGYFFAPMILIIPLMFSTIVGAESFVGEKERKTIEALVFTPASDLELFAGKVIASVVPAILLTWLSFFVYLMVVNIASWPVMGYPWFPPPAWWPLMFWLAPALATLGMAVSVLISARVNKFMEAYQLSGSLVILVLLLVVGQVTGVLYLNTGMSLLVGLLIWLLDIVLIKYAVKVFSRESLLSR